MLKFICPECKTENMLNEGTSTCLCAGCSLVHRIVPELNTNIDATKLRSAFENSFFKSDFSTAFDYAVQYDDAVKTIPSYYIRECLSAIVNGTEPNDALVEQFIMLGFVGHKRMMAWKILDTWLKTQFTHKFYSQWLLALSDFQFQHKAVLSESSYEGTARAELNRVLTPDITYGLNSEKNCEQSEDTSAELLAVTSKSGLIEQVKSNSDIVSSVRETASATQPVSDISVESVVTTNSPVLVPHGTSEIYNSDEVITNSPFWVPPRVSEIPNSDEVTTDSPVWVPHSASEMSSSNEVSMNSPSRVAFENLDVQVSPETLPTHASDDKNFNSSQQLSRSRLQDFSNSTTEQDKTAEKVRGIIIAIIIIFFVFLFKWLP